MLHIQTRFSDGTCKSGDGFETSCEEAVGSETESSSLWNLLMDSKATNITSSYNTFIYLVVTAVTVLLFTLGYYFIEVRDKNNFFAF